MTRVLTEGFEMGDTLAFTVVNNFNVGTGTVRSGVYAATAGMNGTNHGSRAIAAIAEGFIRMAFRWTNTPAAVWPIIRWQKGATQLGSLRINTAGRLALYTSTGTLVATGTNILSVNTWYVIEARIKIDDSSGELEARVDGISEVTFSGDTKPGSDADFDTLHMGSCDNASTGGGTNWFMDDVAVNNTAGGVDDSWCGDGRIVAVNPNANGDVSQLLGSDGNSTDNYLLVDEVPSNGDTDYVASATAGQYDLYNIADFTPRASHTIGRVWVESRSKEESAGGDSIQLGIKPSGGSEDWSGNIPVGASYARYVGSEYLLNPDDSAVWEEADIDALQIGVKVV